MLSEDIALSTHRPPSEDVISSMQSLSSGHVFRMPLSISSAFFSIWKDGEHSLPRLNLRAALMEGRRRQNAAREARSPSKKAPKGRRPRREPR